METLSGENSHLTGAALEPTLAAGSGWSAGPTLVGQVSAPLPESSAPLTVHCPALGAAVGEEDGDAQWQLPT